MSAQNADTARPAAPAAPRPIRPAWWPAETAAARGQAGGLLAALLGPALSEGYRRLYTYDDVLTLGLELGAWELCVPLDAAQGPPVLYGPDGHAVNLSPGTWREELRELGRLLQAVAAAPALRPVEVADVAHDLPDLAAGAAD